MSWTSLTHYVQSLSRLRYHPHLMKKRTMICSTWLRIKIFHTVPLRLKSHHLSDTLQPRMLLIFRFHPLVFQHPQFAPRLLHHLLAVVVQKGANLTRQQQLVTSRDLALLPG